MSNNETQYSVTSQLWPGSSVHAGCQVCQLDFGAIGNLELPPFRHNLILHIKDEHGLTLLEAREDYRKAIRKMLDRRDSGEGDIS